jgi:hypothetical protein
MEAEFPEHTGYSDAHPIAPNRRFELFQEARRECGARGLAKGTERAPGKRYSVIFTFAKRPGARMLSELQVPNHQIAYNTLQQALEDFASLKSRRRKDCNA